MAALDVARRDTGFDALIHPKADDAIEALDAGEYSAMLVDLTTPGAARFCHEARARRALFNVPLIALSPKLTDLAFSNALRWGADDVVELGAAEPLSARLQALPKEVAPIIDPTRGEAVIADPERGRCDVLGRVLANAGFNVKYATDAVTTRFYLAKTSVKLFILNTELGDPATLITDARAQNSSADWVVTTKTLDVEGVRNKLRGLKNVMVMSSHGPPENALFALNLLHPSQETQRRAEVRALYGAIVLFRPVGLDRDEFGFSYSVSPRGLYLRTLLMPPSERLWMEMSPPNVPRRVKLLAEVAWSRTFGEAGAGTAPAGFGVRILDGLGDDLELWRQGFESLDIKVPAGGVPEVSTSTSSSFRVPLPSTPPARASRAPAGSSLSPGRSSRLPSRSSSNIGRISTLPRLSTTPPLRINKPVAVSRPPGLGAKAASTAPVVVPPTTWSQGDGPTAKPADEKKPTQTSQDAVMQAIRASLPPGALQERPAGASKLPPPQKVGVSQESSPEQAAAPPVTPSSTEVADPNGSVMPRSSTIDVDTGAPIDFDDEDIPDRPSRKLPDSKLGPPIVAQAGTDNAAEQRAGASTANGAIADSDAETTRSDETPRSDEIPRKETTTVVGIGQLSHLPGTVQIEDAQAPPISLADLDDEATREQTAESNEDGAEASAGSAAGTPSMDMAKGDHDEKERTAPARVPALPSLPMADTVRADRATSLLDTDLESLAPGADEGTHRGVALGNTRTPEVGVGSDDLGTPIPPPVPDSPSLARSGLIAAAVTMVALVVGLQVYERIKPRPESVPASAIPPHPSAPWSAPKTTVGSGEPSATAALPTEDDQSPPRPQPERRAGSGETKANSSAKPAPPPPPPAQEEPTAHNEPPTPAEPADPVPSELAEPVEPVELDDDPPGPVGTEEAQADGTQSTEPAGQPIPERPDARALPKDQSYLYVRSAIDARVFVHGVDVGRTNQWLQSHCGFRFIRLGTAPGQWLSQGRPTKLGCRRANQIELQPDQ